MHKYAKIAIIGAVALLPIYCMAADDKSKPKVAPVAAAKPGQNAPAAQRPGNHMPRGWNKLDANHDGTVTKDEFLAMPSHRFDEMDANRDGKVSVDEMRAFNDKRRQQAMERGARRQGGQPKQPMGVPPKAGQ